MYRWPRLNLCRPVLGRVRGPARTTLARRYALLLTGVTLSLLVASGLSEAWFGYREARLHIAEIQSMQAEGAADELARYCQMLEAELQTIAKLPWGLEGFDVERRRTEFYRMMQLQPAFTDLQVFDAQGRERLAVSKREADRVDSMRDVEDTALLPVNAGQPLRFGRTFHRDDLTPAMRIAMFDGAGAIVATVDLRLLSELVARLRIGGLGRAYVVDAKDVLIAHSEATEALRRVELREFAPLRRARAANLPSGGTLALGESEDFHGRPVIATAALVALPDWLLFVEEPSNEASRTMLATLGRTGLLVLVGGCAAVAVGWLSARRMAEPIVALRRATERIAEGELESPIDVGRPDEIGDLARDFKLMAARLRESYADLERKIAERTQQLSEARDNLALRATEVDGLNAQLVEQLGELAARKDEADRANAAKTRFLATASHDLRQPMHSVSLLMGALYERLVSGDAVSIADKVLAAVATMEHLFESLLDISKLDAGAVRPELWDLPLGEVFARIEQVWAPQAADRGLRLVVRPTRLFVRTDETLIERIIGNLVSNAIRYTQKGTVLLAARLCGDQVRVQVWDSGPGIALEHREAIFQEFYRIDTPGAGAKGLGLGLSIVQRSANILQHELRVDSRIGKGSRFEVGLPRATPGTVGWASSSLPIVGTDAIAGSFVVVADDDIGNRHALANLLQSWGCHILVAASTDEALARSAEHLRSPDLILSDLQLDGKDSGLRLTAALRDLHDEAIPVIVLTASTDSLPAETLATLGGWVLRKPVSPARLLSTMLRAISRSVRP